MMKKILCIFPILLFVFLFSSCSPQKPIDDSNAIVFSVAQTGEGGARQTISFPTKEFDKLGEKKDAAVKDLALEIKRKLFFPIFYSHYQSSVKLSNQEYVLGGQKVTYSQPMQNKETRTVDFSFCFQDELAWKLYHLKDGDSDTQTNKGLFLIKQMAESDFVFAQDVSGQYLGEFFHNVLSTVYEKYDVNNPAELDFVYKYTVLSNKIRTNADSEKSVAGGTEYEWRQSYAHLGEEKPIKIYALSPRREVWYVFALVATITIMLISYLFHIFAKKKKRKA